MNISLREKKIDVIKIPIVNYSEFTGGVIYTSLATNDKIKYTGSIL